MNEFEETETRSDPAILSPQRDIGFGVQYAFVLPKVSFLRDGIDVVDKGDLEALQAPRIR